ncbi:MAG: transcriptional regulator [Deltaproteobacteria bacterium HGW-Deltaproteobacteria-6]|jgi:predicted DNA-binding transcriptional regulator YafY|nr:MAG: transcriptional regulator [Deltaproteobacteria bacterium HGW-Deltaproteobacteria-6]
MKATENPKKRLIRLGQILKIFMEREKVSTTWLSKHFQTTPRTIQRDLILLKEADFPLNEPFRGNYQIDKTLLKNFDVFDDTELAMVIAIKNLVGQLGEPFEQAAGDIFNKLYEDVTTSPVFIKIDDSVILDKRQFNKIVKTIREKRQGTFLYEGFSHHEFSVEPYRVCFFDGFWYLVGKDLRDQQFKRYALDKIKDFKPLNKNFRCVPAQVDRMLKESGNIWFSAERNIEVVVEVDKSCAHYFRRRKVLPHQEIKQELTDGAIIVSFKVGSLDEIKNTIKVWLPNIKIIQPEELKNIFLKDMKAWISWQKES